MLEKLAAAGMNIVRLNMSHGDHESAAQVIKSIKTLNRKLNYPIAVLMDTQGPEIRTGDLANELELKNGSVITITVRDTKHVEESSFHIHYDDLIDTVVVGDRITVDNGIINLEVLNKNEDGTMQCKVVDGGILIIDDYGHFKGAKKAVDEYFISINEKPLMHRIDYSGRMIIKKQ